jgi:FkbM family methyltransferase
MHRDSLTVRALEFYGTKIRHKGQWRIHPWLRRLFGINLNAEFYVTRSGLVWRLNPNNYVESDLFWLDLKDPWEIHNIKNLIAPGSIIFDIGANFGYYSCMIAKMLSGCKIYAFEPLAYNFERLKTNISLNNMEGCVQVHKLGMSDSEGTATMSLNIKNSGAAHIISNGGDIIITTIDNFCKSKKVEKIDFIKIDVEGYELLIVQ